MNNEFGQITCLLFTATKSMDEIAPQLQQLNEAWEQLGVQVSFRCFYCCYCSLCCVFHVNYFQQVINFNLAELNLIVALLF
jgi:ferredoxin